MGIEVWFAQLRAELILIIIKNLLKDLGVSVRKLHDNKLHSKLIAGYISS